MSDVWAGPPPTSEGEAVDILAAGYDCTWRGVYIVAEHDGEDEAAARIRLWSALGVTAPRSGGTVILASDKLNHTEPSWCVVIAKPMAEQIAARSLRQAGYREYLPMERKILRGHRDNKGKPVLRPLFPRYLFAELHPGQQWRPIMCAIGVSDLIWQDERPALISAEIIDAVRQAEQHEQLDEPRRRPIPAGTLVRIENGPFSELLGRVMAATESNRINVFLADVMGGLPANFRREQLAVVEA